ncbi:HEPN domain-containing protein [Gilvimarinus sp. 1_MG-2023]|uniref:HEPN domain-containing protein n=1 Tax=Gilvimarinus sp. 1_MG-2023 TaxID=3062638 RepID=UPI0026E2373B|nr:HEPN domain-containing protein [Gilvimarinus sp. 1_MG-2023]MDO6748051.1 HEPN domain-containing protein [Gilvimarinus sp. 1_MG-2023]
MTSRARHQSYRRYKSRIDNLFRIYSEERNPDPEALSHNAKYLAVLTSGYLEQAIKELLLHYASKGANQKILRYVEVTWPISRNMTTENIKIILSSFNSQWGEDFEGWLLSKDERKGHINSIVKWRNGIAHGQESNTTGVTMVSVKTAFDSVEGLVEYIESLLEA